MIRCNSLNICKENSNILQCLCLCVEIMVNEIQSDNLSLLVRNEMFRTSYLITSTAHRAQLRHLNPLTGAWLTCDKS